MKHFRSARIKSRLGFSLVEAALSVGVLSFGFLSLAPVLGLGLSSAHQARDNRISAQIAQGFADQAREGTLTAGTAYCDNEGAACPQAGAAYQVQTTLGAMAGGCTRLTVQVAPVATPNRPFDYAVVLPPTP
jgi:Tfp pilus assembly protein PilV